MFFAGRYDINSCCVDAAVTEYIGKLGDVLLNSVKRAGEQVAKVMRKHFAGIDIRVPAELFHLTPYVRSADRIACFGNKDRAVADMMPLRVFQQLLLQIAHDDDRPRLALAIDFCVALSRRLNGDKL